MEFIKNIAGNYGALLTLAVVINSYGLAVQAKTKGEKVAARTPGALTEIFVARTAYRAWWSRSGEAWLALFSLGAKNEKHFELKAVQSKIYVDSHDGIIKLGAQDSPDPILFITDPSLAEGEIKEIASQVQLGVPLMLNEKKSIEFDFANSKWELSRKSFAKKGATHDYIEAKVHYYLKEKSPSHPDEHSFDMGEDVCRLSIKLGQSTCEEKVVLNFIGDLDHDGVPDIYFLPAPDRQGSEGSKLFLSAKKTLASAGESKAVSKDLRAYKAITRPKPSQNPGTAPTSAQILVTGVPRSPIKNVYSGDDYFGVYPNGDLRALKIWVACAQGTCEEKNVIETSLPGQPLFLVRGIPGLATDTKIKTAKITALPVDPDKEDVFPSYTLRTGALPAKLTGGAGFFELESGGTKKKLVLKTQDPDDKPKLIWAGDLNNDGKLDLFFQVKQDDGQNFLFFASPLGANTVSVEPAAQFCLGECP